MEGLLSHLSELLKLFVSINLYTHDIVCIYIRMTYYYII